MYVEEGSQHFSLAVTQHEQLQCWQLADTEGSSSKKAKEEKDAVTLTSYLYLLVQQFFFFN